MTQALLYLERDAEIARLVINRPAKRNALSLEMWKVIPLLIDEVARDTALKVLIIQGVDETAFAAGADIGEIAECAGDEGRGWQYMDAVHAAETAIGGCEKPVIAMIRGDCIGGGVEIALACDFRFAATGSRFGITPAKLGLVYSLASTKRLTEVVGPALARDYLFSARLFDLAEARSAGLVDRDFSLKDIEEATQTFARALCQRSQWSVRAAKAIVQAALDGAVVEDAQVRRLRGGAFTGPDLQEGVQAFRERRSARFTWS